MARRVPAQRPPALRRPFPPADLREICFEAEEARFVPAPDVVEWARAVFIEGIRGSTLQNEEHSPLSMAHLGVLWTDGKNGRHGRVIVGTAEIPTPKGDGWQRARQYQQLRDWFGTVPDFVITLSAPYAAAASDAQFCALVEHELYHCAQKEDPERGPLFDRETGVPLWAIRGHDVEQFTGVVRRYGADAAGVRELVEAAQAHERDPLFPASAIAGACGTCVRAAA